MEEYVEHNDIVKVILMIFFSSHFISKIVPNIWNDTIT